MQSETRESLQRRLKTLHKNLAALEEQKAKMGLDVTVRVLNEIEDTQQQIAELEDRLTHGDFGADGRFLGMRPPRIYHNLPQPDYGTFIGREEELAQVHRILRPYPHSQEYLVTIDGIGGIGKSALALETAYRYLRQYEALLEEERFGAIIWTSAKSSVLTADGIAPRQQITRTLDDIYTTVAVVLEREDITRARPEEQDELVTKALTQQRTLLIVDNLETVDDEQVNAFLRELPAPTKAIVTTRHRIDVAYPVRLTGMPKEDGLALIAQECAKKGVTLTETEMERLYDRTGGVPLAITWSVAQMGYGYGVEAVLRRLGEPTGDIARFCFEEAITRIHDTAAYRLLIALSLFSTDASREALGYVADLPALDRDDGLVALEKLSLVNRESDRFSALPLTREYALQDFELGRSGLDYWDFLVQNGPRLVEVILEAGDLHAQADFALWEVSGKLISRGEYAKAEKMIRQIESVAAAQGLSEVKANAWYLLALLFREMRDFHKASQWFDRAEAFYREKGPTLAVAAILNRRADAFRKMGDFGKAKECIAEALELLDTPSIESRKRFEQRIFLLGDLGFTLSREGNYEEAEKYIDQCIGGLEGTRFERRDQVMATAYIEKAVVTYYLRGLEEANEWAIKAEERINRSGIKRPTSDGDEEWLRITGKYKTS